MDAVPGWLVAIVLAVGLAVSLEAGWRLRRALQPDLADSGGPGGTGTLAAAALGLLSLLIGFTLAISLDRYEARRSLVVEEANAISTVWIRNQMLGQPYRGQLEGLLRDYVRERRALASVDVNQLALDGADRRAGVLQQRIWQETEAGLRAPGASPLTTTVLQSAGQMFDAAALRRAALDAEVPPPILWALVVVAIIAAGLTGYGLAEGSCRHPIAGAALCVAVALALGLIFDLDEPRGGLIQVSQAPMERVADMILTAPPSPGP